MEPTSAEKNETDSSPAPRTGVRLMVVIFIGLALVTLYANVQHSRRDKLEQVVTIPASTATPAVPSPQ